jgi:hypothetical protein
MGLKIANRGDFSLQNSAPLHFFGRNDTESYYDERDAQRRAPRALAHPLFKKQLCHLEGAKRLRDLLAFCFCIFIVRLNQSTGYLKVIRRGSSIHWPA